MRNYFLILYVITGALPFSEYENPMTAMYQIASGKAPPIGMNIVVSDEVKSFISACCAVDPMHRLSVDQLLTHPFVNHPYSNDNTLIMISDENLEDSNLFSDNNDYGNNSSNVNINNDNDNVDNVVASPILSTISLDNPEQIQKQHIKIEQQQQHRAIEKNELTFKSRIPILQSRAIKVNVDSPDNPMKKSIEDQSTPSIYRARKSRDIVVPKVENNQSPPILTPTPPPIESKQNTSTRFRKQSSRGGGVPNGENSSDDNSKMISPMKNSLDSPMGSFSDQELSPVNQSTSNFLSPQEKKVFTSATVNITTTEKNYTTNVDVASKNDGMSIDENETDKIQEVEKSNKIVNEIELNKLEMVTPTSISIDSTSSTPTTILATATTATTTTPSSHSITKIMKDENLESMKSCTPRKINSINSTTSNPPSQQQMNTESEPENQKKKKELRFESHSAPSQEKVDFLSDGSNDNIPVIMINGSMVNSNGAVLKVGSIIIIIIIIITI